MTNPLEPTFEWAKDAPPKMDWATYVDLAQAEFESLLKDHPDDEKRMQKFLEQNPCYLPPQRAFHGGWPHMVVTQPRLAGYSGHVPDFMIVEQDSRSICAVLVEIEAPGKKWSTQKGLKSRELEQAEAQLAHWRAWFADGDNPIKFAREFKLPTPYFRERFVQRYVLIFGQRDETMNHSKFGPVRERLTADDQVVMSYGRLGANKHYDNLVTVKSINQLIKDAPAFELVGMQPTFGLGPSSIDVCRMVKLKEEVVDALPVDDERKAFIKERWSYWAHQEESGPMTQLLKTE